LFEWNLFLMRLMRLWSDSSNLPSLIACPISLAHSHFELQPHWIPYSSERQCFLPCSWPLYIQKGMILLVYSYSTRSSSCLTVVIAASLFCLLTKLGLPDGKVAHYSSLWPRVPHRCLATNE
jgi:hypothetical protein